MFLESFHSFPQYSSIISHPLTLLKNLKMLFGNFFSEHPKILLEMEST